MGTLMGCKTCETFQNYDGAKQLFDISDYYTGRLGDFKQILPQIPQYVSVNHARLINDLRIRQQKFIDLIFPSQNLLNNPNIQWKRIIDVYPQQNFIGQNGNFQFQFKKQNTYKSQISNLQDVLIKLNKFPDLLKKIFVNLEISKQGFYVLYFCINGNIIKRIQIIIDDYIPINHEGRYIYRQPKEGKGIWMLLIQKAWAKILKSYHNIQKKTSNELFSQITGVPIPNLYKIGDFLISGKYDFQPNQSKYLKICRDTSVSMVLCVWQQGQLIDEANQGISNAFIIELMTENRTLNGVTYNLVEMGRISNDRKLTLVDISNKGMFNLQSGKHIFHIFNRSSIKKQCNIVIHARVPVNAHTRYQKQFKQIKMQMIKNEYKKKNDNIPTQYQYSGIQLKFCWIEHRGIFQLVNKLDVQKIIEMNIKKQFINDIIFQDQKQSNKIIRLPINKKFIVVIIRKQNKQYGPFYKINMKS